MKLKEKVVHPTRSPDREANERFVHLRNKFIETGSGRHVRNVTAFVRTIDGVEYVSFAECDERDQFCRRTGRVIARRKWFQGKRTRLATIEMVEAHTTQPVNLYDRVVHTYDDVKDAEGDRFAGAA
jgi:hypothetical protein